MSTIKLTKDIKIKFEESVSKDGNFGVLNIRGISFPDEDILPKFASSWRKRTFEKYSITASGTFSYDYKDAIPHTECRFYLDYSGIGTESEKRIYEERFVQFFPDLAALFEEMIETFLFDFEDGYIPYLKFVENGNVDKEICDKMLDNFLRKFNFKTLADDENKQRFQKGIQDLIQRLNYTPNGGKND